jgi:hypothetical protein
LGKKDNEANYSYPEPSWTFSPKPSPRPKDNRLLYLSSMKRGRHAEKSG